MSERHLVDQSFRAGLALSAALVGSQLLDLNRPVYGAPLDGGNGAEPKPTAIPTRVVTRLPDRKSPADLEKEAADKFVAERLDQIRREADAIRAQQVSEATVTPTITPTRTPEATPTMTATPEPFTEETAIRDLTTGARVIGRGISGVIFGFFGGLINEAGRHIGGINLPNIDIGRFWRENHRTILTIVGIPLALIAVAGLVRLGRFAIGRRAAIGGAVAGAAVLGWGLGRGLLGGVFRLVAGAVTGFIGFVRRIAGI